MRTIFLIKFFKVKEINKKETFEQNILLSVDTNIWQKK